MRKNLDQDNFSLSYSGWFPTLKEVEDFFIREVMKVADGNEYIVAAFPGVNQATISRRLRDKEQEGKELAVMICKVRIIITVILFNLCQRFVI